MKKIGILGGTGYTALELIEILQRHPECRIARLTSRDPSKPQLQTVHPRIQSLQLAFEAFELDSFCSQVDFAFSCLPHATSAESVSAIVSRGIPVVDFSADYRLESSEQFESIYEIEHPDPGRIPSVPYGLPELFRTEIQNSNVIANPGCFPTSILLPLAPLTQQKLIPGGVIADSKTGITGAGRKANLKFHFPECNDSVAAYGVGTHRHRPEIENVLKRFSNEEIPVTFTPHLIPMDRGILSTIYLPGSNPTQIRDCLADAYQNEPFVKLVDQVPSTKDVLRTNRCHLFVGSDQRNTIIVSVIDNLQKGASGAAVQNFNLVCGFPETLGLVG